MVNVARNSLNTLVFRKVTVRFRRYPGNDAEGALGRATYVLRTGLGSVGGLTRSDGSVIVRVPSGGSVQLEIFGSSHEISLGPPPASAATLSGLQERLSMLGYRTGPVDGKPDPGTESAVLVFQADHGLPLRGLTPSGGVDEATRKSLEAETGP